MARNVSKKTIYYQARFSSWIIFRAIYWSIYIFFIGSILLYYSYRNISFSIELFFGLALTLLSIMLIIYGAVEVLSNNLMRRYV